MVCWKCNHKRPKALNPSYTSAQPEHRHRGNFNHSRLKLMAKKGANYCEPVGLDRQSKNRDADMWRFAEEGSEDDNDQLTSWDEVPESNAFPSSRDEGGSRFGRNFQIWGEKGRRENEEGKTKTKRTKRMANFPGETKRRKQRGEDENEEEKTKTKNEEGKTKRRAFARVKR
ncbi:hypothetical protein WN944_003368 [Citrus x changshan-huyou]|uniref:Uncharacterized protein n=1 Tax=Citrus x changshan-huyou TaxID=2935761 RepID=A0AAP0QGR8_9ROSI